MKRKIVGVRFSKVGKIYHFDSSRISDLQIGDKIIVETSRGWQLGEITHFVPEEKLSNKGSWKHIDRRATSIDLLMRKNWENKENSVVENLKVKVKELNIKNIKIFSAEYSFDGKQLTVLFSSEAEEKIDTKKLKQYLHRKYSNTKIDVRQIGPRDVAKLIEGLGACGMEKRCCSKFLCEFSSISIRMAKEQGVSLTPSEITGMCGRLRCCLFYEYEQYAEGRKLFPKKSKQVETPLGIGRIVEVQPLTPSVLVEIEGSGVQEFSSEEIKPLEKPRTKQK